MADTENEQLETTEAEEVVTGSKKKLILIIAAVCILFMIGLGAYFIFFNESTDAIEETAEQQIEASTSNEIIDNVYVAMPLPFVFNIQDGKRTRLVQIKVQLMVSSRDDATLAKKHMPLLESTIVRVLSSKNAEQLRKPEGKETLKEELLSALNDATSKVEQKALISAVLFTGFVLQ